MTVRYDPATKAERPYTDPGGTPSVGMRGAHVK